MGKDMSR